MPQNGPDRKFSFPESLDAKLRQDADRQCLKVPQLIRKIVAEYYNGNGTSHTKDGDGSYAG